MAHPAFDFEVITPEGPSFRGRVTTINLPGRKGNFGILARHAPMVAALDTGMVTLETEAGASLRLVVGEGFVEVHRKGVRALVDFCNTRSEIDQPRAAKAKARAQERLRSRAADVDRLRAEAALRRAVARLRVAQI